MSAHRSSGLPHFIIIGAAKSGTTSLFKYLQQHPKIFMTNPKEPCFFDENENWNKGKDWYYSLFEKAQDGQLCGEASTNYTRWPQVTGVPQKLYEFFPDVKLIYLMREPSQRAFAHYVHRWLKELHPGEPFSVKFEDFVKDDPMCIDSGFYRKQLDQYTSFFSKSQIYPVVFEELLKNPQLVMEGVFNFLGLEIPKEFEATLPKENESKSFRYDKTKAAYSDQLKKSRLFSFLSTLISPSLKNLLYEKILSKTKTAAEIQSIFEPIPLTTEEKQKLKEIYAEENLELKKKYNVNIDSWL